jgi:hypothetical protein
LEDQDLVLGFKKGGTVKAYPHPILDHHEVVNDEANGVALAVTYCPLTGTGIGWDRVVDGNKTTFGVSGLLYNNNLIPYDRETESNWSQMKNKCVNGERIGTAPRQHQLVETTWGTWKAMYPQTKVLSSNTGHNRNYDVYPYGDYKTSNELLYPVTYSDDRLSKKERVLGVVANEQAKAYRFKDFKGDSVSLVRDQVGASSVVVAGSRSDNFLLAFECSKGDSTFQFRPVQDSLPVIMKSSNGTAWDLFGNAVAGPDAGVHLNSPESYIGYWFAWAAFYPELELR